MKESELREVAKCVICGKGIMHSGLPLFYRVRIVRYGLKMNAIKRQQGMAEMLDGHALLAEIMGPNEDMAEQILSKEITVCETCSVKQTSVAELAMEDK